MNVSVLDNITKKVTDTAKAAAKLSGSVVEVTRLNMSINAEEEKVRKIYTEMGKQVYEDYNEGKLVGEKLLEKCVKIDEIIANIDAMKEKILELKNVKACPNCGLVLAIDMEYCYKCGKKQEMQEQHEQQDQEPEKSQEEQA
jgi:ribosomal protein S27AE